MYSYLSAFYSVNALVNLCSSSLIYPSYDAPPLGIMSVPWACSPVPPWCLHVSYDPHLRAYGVIHILPQHKRALQDCAHVTKTKAMSLNFAFEAMLFIVLLQISYIVHCLLLVGMLKLHHSLRLYCSLSKSFFRYVAGTSFYSKILKTFDYNAIPVFTLHASVVCCSTCYPPWARRWS